MTRRGFVVMLVALAAATPLAGQSRGGSEPRDAITGSWKGELLPEGAERGRPVTLDLQHDGRGKVSGTLTGMPSPADVKEGTFDRKTGVLKLQLGKSGEPAVLMVLEGTVAKNAVSGRMTGEVSGEFKLTKSDTAK